MIHLLIQVRELKEILSIESVSVIGLLLAFACYMIWEKKRAEKAYKEEKDQFFAEIKQLRQEVINAKDEAKQESDDYQQKYYTLATKILDKLDHFNDVFRQSKQ